MLQKGCSDVRKLTFTNSEGSSVVFSDSSSYRTTKVNGLGVPDISVEEKGSPLQDGTVVIDQMVEARLITVEGILPTARTTRPGIVTGKNLPRS